MLRLWGRVRFSWCRVYLWAFSLQAHALDLGFAMPLCWLPLFMYMAF
jgi:hypothetical protein